MLADISYKIVPRLGTLDSEIHLPETAKKEVIGFIVEELPRWRDHPDRPTANNETTLTEFLCDHLNSAAYYSINWSHIQFRTETHAEPDNRGKTDRRRKIDLTVKPRAVTFVIEGRRHSQFDALFPIECKRLPTPRGTKRDEREYVFSKFGTTGGIQRFKFGYHGAGHTFVAIIAYVQKQTCSYWFAQINGWIQELAEKSNSDWRAADSLELLHNDLETGVSTLRSELQRTGDLEKCELHHLWIEMWDS
jgi:hypothetical protein